MNKMFIKYLIFFLYFLINLASSETQPLPSFSLLQKEQIEESTLWVYGFNQHAPNQSINASSLNPCASVFKLAVGQPNMDLLVIILSRDEIGRATAEFFNVNNTTYELSYSEKLNTFTLSIPPVLTLKTRFALMQCWFTGINEKPNYDLEISLDGKTKFSTDTPTDSIIDAKVYVYQNAEGYPHIQISSRLSKATHRFPNIWQAIYNIDDAIIQQPLPLLSAFPHFSLQSDILPPISFDLENTELTFNGFVHPDNGNWYKINSNHPPPQVDFESPIASYNFDDSQSDIAHLNIYAQNFVKGSKTAFNESLPLSQTNIHYSWKMFDSKKWTYSLHLARPEEYEGLTQLADWQVNVPSHENLPRWTMLHSWPTITFVESLEGLAGNEGVHVYGFQNGQVYDWQVGVVNQPPSFLAKPFLPETATPNVYSRQGIPVGFRGEYITAYGGVPKLYLSPIDHRVHLFGAEGGVWNLGEQRILKTLDLNKDKYIDTWLLITLFLDDEEVEEIESIVPRVEQGETNESLYMFGDYLIYSGAEGVIIKQVSVYPTAIMIEPPVDKATWEIFREIVKENTTSDLKLDTLISWQKARQGNIMLAIDKGSISKVISSHENFQFILNVPSLQQITNNQINQELSVGSHLLRYSIQNNSWQVTDVTPPSIQVSISTPKLTQMLPNNINIYFYNQNTQDEYTSGKLIIAEEVVANWENLLVSSESERTLNVQWTPLHSGSLEAQLVLANANKKIIQSLTVDKTFRITGLQALLLGQYYNTYKITLLIVVLLCLAFCSTWWIE